MAATLVGLTDFLNFNTIIFTTAEMHIQKPPKMTKYIHAQKKAEVLLIYPAVQLSVLTVHSDSQIQHSTKLLHFKGIYAILAALYY